MLLKTRYCRRRNSRSAREIGESMIHTAQQVGESAPLTGETIRNAATRAKTSGVTSTNATSTNASGGHSITA